LSLKATIALERNLISIRQNIDQILLKSGGVKSDLRTSVVVGLFLHWLEVEDLPHHLLPWRYSGYKAFSLTNKA